jgi:hypothetical protein
MELQNIVRKNSMPKTTLIVIDVKRLVLDLMENLTNPLKKAT